jgi:hypothetical protein
MISTGATPDELVALLVSDWAVISVAVRLSTGTSSSLTFEPQATSSAERTTAQALEKIWRFMNNPLLKIDQ